MRRAPWHTPEALVENLHRVEMILTPDPIPLSVVQSVERVDPDQDRYDDFPDEDRPYGGWLEEREEWWAQMYPEGHL